MMNDSSEALSGRAADASDENPFPPKSIIMAQPATYSPLTYLARVARDTEPKLAFVATTPRTAEAWRRQFRPILWDLLGESHTPGISDPAARMIESRTFNTYTREKWVIDVDPGRSMPFYVLRPKSGPKAKKVVLCLHGHGGGARDVIGDPGDAKGAELIENLNTDYALQVVKRGWCAVAPDLFAFGERLDDVEDARPGFDGGCEKPFLNAIQVGKTLIGIRTKDICTLIDWLGFRSSEFDLTDLACLGLSGGGMMTMYAAALDDRIRRALISGFVAEAAGAILAIRHCSCCYVPRLMLYCDIPDIAGLVAPRFLIVQSGRRDAIFPIESARAAIGRIRAVYDVCGSPETVMFHEHDGFHSFWAPSLDALLV